MNRRTPYRFGVACVAILLLASPALAQQPVGTVIAMQGQATAVDPAGAIRDLALKAPVQFQDTIHTPAGGILQIMFLDESVVSQGENSTLTIDAFVYDPDKVDESNCLLRATKGLFRVVTGRITQANPERFKVKTKMATIGIRGCEVGFRVDEDREMVYIIELPGGRRIIIQKDFVDPAKIRDGRVDAGDLLEVLKAGLLVIIEEEGGLQRRVATSEELRALILGTTPGGDAPAGAFFLPGPGVPSPFGPAQGGGPGDNGHWNNQPNPGLPLPGEPPPAGGGSTLTGGGGGGGGGVDGEYKYVRHGSGIDWEWGFYGYVSPVGSDHMTRYERPEILNNSVPNPFIGGAFDDPPSPYEPFFTGPGLGMLTGQGISAAVVEDAFGVKRAMQGTCALDLNIWGYGKSDWRCLVAMGDSINGLTFQAAGGFESDGTMVGNPGVLADTDASVPFQLTVDGVAFRYPNITFQEFVGTVVGPGGGTTIPISGGILDYGIQIDGGAAAGGRTVVGIAGADVQSGYPIYP